jgi:hypothetical protein
MNEVGVGVPVDRARAATLYERACRAGNVRGCANLGVARVEGMGGRDVPIGAQLLELACDRGDARGCMNLARLHSSGQGVARDPALAARLFGFACDHEEESACVALAQGYEDAAETAKALDLYRKACALGEATACAHEGSSLVSLR